MLWKNKWFEFLLDKEEEPVKEKEKQVLEKKFPSKPSLNLDLIPTLFHNILTQCQVPLQMSIENHPL